MGFQRGPKGRGSYIASRLWFLPTPVGRLHFMWTSKGLFPLTAGVRVRSHLPPHVGAVVAVDGALPQLQRAPRRREQPVRLRGKLHVFSGLQPDRLRLPRELARHGKAAAAERKPHRQLLATLCGRRGGGGVGKKYVTSKTDIATIWDSFFCLRCTLVERPAVGGRADRP